MKNKKSLSALIMLCVLVTCMPAIADVKYKKDDSALNNTYVLVNHTHKLSYEYIPEDLVVPAVLRPDNKDKNKVMLRPAAALALEELFADAKANGHILYAVSGYRSYYEQKKLYEEKAASIGEKQAMRIVAPQGTSEHQLGLGMDINGQSTLKKGLDTIFGQSPEGLWVAQNAYRFGFIIRYPEDKTNITGYRWEPWHLRYVGEDIAADIFKKGLTLDEYYDLYLKQEKQVTSFFTERKK